MDMKKRLSRKQMFFNKINLTKDDEVYVGIDVHKKSHSVEIWLNDAPAIDFVMPAENEKLVKLLEKLRIALKMIVYEAGPAGYSLARQLQEADRQLTRIRERLVSKQTRVKQQIKSFLLQHGLKEPIGLKYLSDGAITKLKAINLSQQLRFCLDILLEELHFLRAQIQKTERQLKETFSHERYVPKMKVLLTHPGLYKPKSTNSRLSR